MVTGHIVQQLCLAGLPLMLDVSAQKWHRRMKAGGCGGGGGVLFVSTWEGTRHMMEGREGRTSVSERRQHA